MTCFHYHNQKFLKNQNHENVKDMYVNMVNEKVDAKSVEEKVYES